MKVNNGLKMLLENCNDWEYRKLVSFILKCESLYDR